MCTARRCMIILLRKLWLRTCVPELITVQGKEGVVIVKTQQAILVAHYPGTVQTGQATNTVEQLGDYLIGVGY